MPVLERQTFIRAPRAQVFDFFAEPRNLARITPPDLGFEVVECPDRKLRQGDRIRYTIRLFGIRVPWVSHISEWNDGTSFTDEQERGPYRVWRHNHRLQDADGGTVMIDRVEYELPMGAIGRLFGGWWVGRNLRHIFDYRERSIRGLFS